MADLRLQILAAMEVAVAATVAEEAMGEADMVEVAMVGGKDLIDSSMHFVLIFAPKQSQDLAVGYAPTGTFIFTASFW